MGKYADMLDIPTEFKINVNGKEKLIPFKARMGDNNELLKIMPEVEKGKDYDKFIDFTTELVHRADSDEPKNELKQFVEFNILEFVREVMVAFNWTSREEFEKNNTVPLGISVDPVPSKSAWAEDIGLENLRLLSDFWPHGDFATKLGIFLKEKGISGRVNILVNDQGEILWAKEYDIPELPDIDEVLEAVAANA